MTEKLRVSASEKVRIFKCGCVVMKTTTRRTLAKESKYAPAIVVPINIWRLTQRCNEHKINFGKRADKVMKEMSKREKKNKIFPKHFT